MWYALCRAAAGTGFTFLMTVLGAAAVFFVSGEPQPRVQTAVLGNALVLWTASYEGS